MCKCFLNVLLLYAVVASGEEDWGCRVGGRWTFLWIFVLFELHTMCAYYFIQFKAAFKREEEYVSLKWCMWCIVHKASCRVISIIVITAVDLIIIIGIIVKGKEVRSPPTSSCWYVLCEFREVGRVPYRLLTWLLQRGEWRDKGKLSLSFGIFQLQKQHVLVVTNCRFKQACVIFLIWKRKEGREGREDGREEKMSYTTMPTSQTQWTNQQNKQGLLQRFACHRTWTDLFPPSDLMLG